MRHDKEKGDCFFLTRVRESDLLPSCLRSFEKFQEFVLISDVTVCFSVFEARRVPQRDNFKSCPRA